MASYRTLRVVAAALAAAVLLGFQLAPIRAATPSSCSIDGVDRIVAVGDVHGAFDRFVDILQTANVIDARGRWIAGRAHFVQLGDVVDRGPDSRKALDLLRRLEGEARSAGGMVHALIGNHEVARMLGDLRFATPGEYQAFVTADSDSIRQRFADSATAGEREQLLKQTPLGMVEMRVAFGRDGVYGKWLRTHDAVVKIDGVVFAHGGISPAVAPQSCDDINATIRRELTTDVDKTRAAPLASLVAREDGPTYYRGLQEQPDTFAPELDDILNKQHASAFVVAHTVSPTGRIYVRFGGEVVGLDTGMQLAYVPNGRASALEIRDGVFTAIYADRREPLGRPGAMTDK